MRVSRFAWTVLLLFGAMGAGGPALAQSDPELDALNRQVQQFHQGGKYEAAVAVAKHYVEVAKRKRGEDDPDYATAIGWLAHSLQATNKLAEAEPLMHRALSIDEMRFGPAHPNVAVRLNNLAQLFYATNRLVDAEPLIRRALAINDKSLDPEHPNLATTLNNLAELLRATYRFEEAEPLIRRALAINEKALGPEHPNVSVGLHNLAQLLQATNRLAAAETFYRRALAIEEKNVGPDHATVAVPLNSLALLLHLSNRHPEAEALFRRALGIKESNFGADHPIVAATLTNLALVLAATGRPSECESLLRRALTIQEASLGSDHPAVASTLGSLARLLANLNRTAEAEPHFRRAVAINEKNFGPEDASDESMLTLTSLAFMLQATGRFAEAETHYRRVLTINEKRYGAHHPKVADALSGLAFLLVITNRHIEAEAPIRRAVAIHERDLARDPAAAARILNDLADVLKNTNRPTEAEPVYRRALAIAETNLGPDHWLVGGTLINLAQLLHQSGKRTEAEAIIRRLLTMPDTGYGADHANRAASLNRLAQLLLITNRPAEAEALLRRAQAIQETSSGPDHPYVAQALSDLAQLLFLTSSRFSEAEQLLRRALSIQETSVGPHHAYVATTLTTLAQLLQATNRFGEAEPLYRRALAIRESSFGPEHMTVAVSLNSVAHILAETNRLSEAEPLIRRALAIQERSSPDHWGVVTTLNNLAYLLAKTDRFTEAEHLLRRALATGEKALGADHWVVATLLNNLAILLQEASRFDEAEPLYRRALTVSEASLDPNHPNVARDVFSLAWLLHATGRLTDAEPLYRRSLAIFETSLGAVHPNLALPLTNLAGLFAERGDWGAALTLHTRALPILTGRSGVQGSDRNDLAKARLVGNARAFRAHARAAYHANADETAAREGAFEAAQWALQTSAADALTQMSARFAKGHGPLAALVRERQDLIIRRRAEDKRLLEAVGAADAKATEAVRAAIVRLDTKLDVIDNSLATEFPAYSELSSPKPLGIGTVQSLLRSDEALVVFLDIPPFGRLPEETLAWAITKTDAQWISVPLGTSALSERVGKLRCGLDREGLWSWSGQRWLARGERCRALKPAGLGTREALPFDLAVAHELYHQLLKPFDDQIKGKSLIIVPSGPLTSLPFHALITERAEAAVGPKGPAPDYRKAAWLALRQSVTVLPSVGSLKALRKLPPSQAKEPYIAFGNPLLDGRDPDSKQAELARSKQKCPRTLATRRQLVLTAFEGPVWLDTIFRGGTVDLKALRSQTPLPETADELCAVAKALGALGRERDTVWLGARASETNLKALSRDGKLARYRVLHFATHGVLAGESEAFLKAKAEPALLLNPPDHRASVTDLEHDNGLLTASEVAQLRLDADWVVLSACNTAAGERGDAEVLSGLARAFFYAKARALLVSHWYVISEAAVKLATGTFAELKASARIGRAEALRRAMAKIITSGGPEEAHPEYWAPFVLVGEGAR